MARPPAADGDYILIGGMSVGLPDPEPPVNALRLDRIPIDELATWLA
jgi:hypothetical protein